MIVTYDLRQDASAKNPVLIHGAKRVSTVSEVLDWEVGEFDLPSGKKVYGVSIRYRTSPDGEISKEVVEVPAHAQNVKVRTGEVPEEYRKALKSAV